jgi:hypothetical protein
LECRFHYETFFQGEAQEGSGTALHLAASRGHIEVVQLLVRRGASLDAMVSRCHKPHYDVLHAAVFAEGRGGDPELVRYLLTAKAKIRPNANGRWPLHLAFQTGSMELISVFLDEAATADEWGNWDSNPGPEIKSQSLDPSPLELGIEWGKMTEEQLANAAPLTPHSLHVFIEHEPRCIPSFLKRMLESKGMSAATLASHISGVHISKMLHEFPNGASDLLDALTETPQCESMGWWPLPARISFAPRNFTERFRYMFNPPPELLQFYQHDTVWKYDRKHFKAPDWHHVLANRTRGRPIKDAEIKVCHVPNIICAEFFAALVDTSEDDALCIYRNAVVRGAISEAWWQGAFKVNITHVCLSVIGLAVLVLEMSLVEEGPLVGRAPVACRFIAAKGVIDLVAEIVQLRGLIKIGMGRDYFVLGNAFDITVCSMQMSLFLQADSQFVMVFIVFVYWMRLGHVFLSAENIARALLPIQRLTYSLGPAGVVTFVGFSAFTHAFYIVRGKAGNFWNDIIPRSFETLITAELPSNTAQSGILEGFLTYAAVLIFSIFVLNVFIGVIGEQYEVQKRLCAQIFQHQRANACFDFLTRARVIPCSLMSVGMGLAMSAVAGLGIFALLFVSLVRSETVAHESAYFAVFQMLLVLAAYQNPQAPWATPCSVISDNDSTHKYYLWLATPREASPASTLDEIHKALRELSCQQQSQQASPTGARYRASTQELRHRASTT